MLSSLILLGALAAPSAALDSVEQENKPLLEFADSTQSDPQRVFVTPLLSSKAGGDCVEIDPEADFETPIGRIKELAGKLDSIAEKSAGSTIAHVSSRASKARALIYFVAGILSCILAWGILRIFETAASVWRVLKQAMNQAQSQARAQDDKQENTMESGGGH